MIIEDDSYLFVVMEIGCIECYAPSNLIGIFQDEQQAIQVRDKCKEKLHWRYGGENEFLIFKFNVNDLNINFVKNGGYALPPYDEEENVIHEEQALSS